MTKPRSYEDKYKNFLEYHKPKYIIGIDEVGWGAIAGPIVVAAVVLPVDYKSSVIKDSKKFGSSKAREKAYEAVMDEALYVCTQIADPGSIGLQGPGQVLQNAWSYVVADTMAFFPHRFGASPSDCLVILDGDKPIKGLKHKHVCFSKADLVVPAVSAASIIAKVRRDNIMRELSKQYPEYEWYKNKGYGTPAHIEAMRDVGVSQEHRTNISVVVDMLVKYGKYEDRSVCEGT